jgi:SecD/SecF fusion protein
MKSMKARALVYGLVILLGLLAALPNLLPAQAVAKLPAWYTSTTISLGLDLQGGSHLLLAADTAELFDAETRTIAEELGPKLVAAGVTGVRPKAESGAVVVMAKKPEQLQAAATVARALARDNSDGTRRFDVVIEGGQLTLTLSDSRITALTNDALERSLEVVRQRLDESGLVEPSITRQGNDGILVQMPGVADPSSVRKLLGTTAKMTFHWVANSDNEALMNLPGSAEGERYSLERRVAMEGQHISDAQLGFNSDNGQPVVNFKLDSDGARQFGEMTRANIGRPLAVVLDGKVITAPVIRSAIAGGSGEISGGFTSAEASSLALLLRGGALPVPLKVLEERTVGPDLGSDAIAMGLSTGLLGAALVFAFMLGLYGRWGAIACVGLAVNVGLVFGVLSVLGATLTLPGIAGIILTIGMAVDANILINERIREETRNGLSAPMAVRQGFSRAYSTILDSNMTTLIAISLLFMFGSGPVRGFAVTIGIGLLTSMFTAIAVTRLLMEWRVRAMGRQPLAIHGIKTLDRLAARGVDFLRGRFIGLALSALLSIGSIVLFFGPGLQYGVDFTGGTLVEVRAENTSVEQLRQALASAGLGGASIQESGPADAGQYLVRLPVLNHSASDSESKADGVVDSLKTAVRTLSPTAEFPKVDMVGPKVSGGFSDATILAILLAGAGMLAYLWIRFESHFAAAATLTIALDLTKTIGFFALTGLEFNLTAVAALLALIGYSVNDKVVVFDRVRENLRLTPGKPMLQLLNESISSTLTRTVFTSVTTLLALLPMGIAGGSAVSSFALPMLFGIVVGTSSSIFIAAPLLYWLGLRRQQKGLPQLRPSREERDAELALIP